MWDIRTYIHVHMYICDLKSRYCKADGFHVGGLSKGYYCTVYIYVHMYVCVCLCVCDLVTFLYCFEYIFVDMYTTHLLQNEFSVLNDQTACIGYLLPNCACVLCCCCFP